MSKYNFIEITIGILVLCLALFLGEFAFNKFLSSGKIQNKCYTVFALFSDVEGVEIGDSVKISGIKIGNVTELTLTDDDGNYTPKMEMCINREIKLPTDSVATIASSNIFGKKYVNIILGTNNDIIKNEDYIENTNSDISLNILIGKLINKILK